MDTHARRKKEKRKRETLSAFIRLGFHLLYSMIKQTWKKRILDEKKQYFLVNDHHMVTTKAYSKICMLLFF